MSFLSSPPPYQDVNQLSPSSSFQQSPAAVKMVAGYALQQRLGSGSFAVVYKGVRVQSSSNAAPGADTVAIKAISRDSEKLTKKVLQNLEVEISILRTYRHRNIVCMHEVQKTDRHFYLILEFCGGGDVQRLIRTRKDGRLSEGLTRRLMRDLAAGLRFLWGQELIHRDIKPQNLLLTGPLPLDEINDPEKTNELEEQRRLANFPTSAFVLKIADFGFARHLQTTSLAETLCGSPLYMAPEILQHHRYDAKADLWSVGTVLFEMISGRPPFHGENHIDLLRNIQKKAVRLPRNVTVSAECVNLLRLLLNRNPLGRAGFQEFFSACDAFVALGCQGVATDDQGTCRKPVNDLGTIPENEGGAPAENLLTPSSTTPQAMVNPTSATMVSHALGAAPAHFSEPSSNVLVKQNATTRPQRALTPLVQSPPVSSMTPIIPIPEPFHLDSNRQMMPSPRQSVQFQGVELATRRTEVAVSQNSSGDDNSFVMVEYGSLHKSPSASTVAGAPAHLDTRQLSDLHSTRVEPPPSTDFAFKNPFPTNRGEVMVVKPPKGMLSTSPGTGGALMGLLSGRTRLLQLSGNNEREEIENQIKASAKMLATAEDVGRRAVSVAHLGDNRAYLAMRLSMLNESCPSLCSTSQMEGIEEEISHQDALAVTDDSTGIMAPARRRRSSSTLDKSMRDPRGGGDDADEMPFAVQANQTAALNARAWVSFNKGVSISSPKPPAKATPAVMRSHFNEGLSCYIKSLGMLKGAVSATLKIAEETDNLQQRKLTIEQKANVQKLKKRNELTLRWLKDQYQGVLDRGEAANTEIGKIQLSPNDRNESVPIASVEELIYNHAIAFGKDGAVKQLLGQFETARSCFRSAGLLAETLLMEPRVVGDDRKKLEGYVDGIAARITELDQMMVQQSRVSAETASVNTDSSRRGSGVVSVVSQALGTSPQMS